MLGDFLVRGNQVVVVAVVVIVVGAFRHIARACWGVARLGRVVVRRLRHSPLERGWVPIHLSWVHCERIPHLGGRGAENREAGTCITRLSSEADGLGRCRHCLVIAAAMCVEAHELSPISTLCVCIYVDDVFVLVNDVHVCV